MKRTLKAYVRSWPMNEPFVIARGAQTSADVVVVEIGYGNLVGRGEAAGVMYAGETPETMLQQIQQVRESVENGVDPAGLLSLLPAGGARNALDAALWDLESKITGVRAWRRAGLDRGDAITTAITIGIRAIPEYEKSARVLANNAWIKIKVDKTDPLGAVRAVRLAAPNAKLVVDANQAWTVEDLKNFMPALLELRVDLLEQPVKVGFDDGLSGYESPIPICADESINTVADLPSLVGRYSFINIKLDKTGGLTTALELAREAQKLGFRLMSGCMCGGSLAMAPAMVLAQLCEINDLDGPMLQSEDWPGGIVYKNGVMTPPWPEFWG
ncbi:N-acetyl-D-Glu racemase DgcA [Stenotrophobium rhamnosiphilum]|uniref:Dipeptide epimerase n=1 Tax=Stenotrophobium rhamnosiphilum TaxID=2029166 RepID=A0A2T5MKJ8_9GAMM|nr:N-acetyl-D-Glu racemase DgcA [Stenotrophobium rhamnosiphilum]PTU33095.1 dipeptide epimerase [Stenotrophobium rhamnosiphilum]